MNRFISISVRMSLMVFAGIAMFSAKANASSLDERFKVALNTAIHDIKEIQDPIVKRKMLEDFLTRMNQGIGMAKNAVSKKDGQALDVLQLKIQTDYAELNGNGVAKVPDTELNHFADYVQQDMEQADGGIYISVGGLIIILLLLIIIF